MEDGSDLLRRHDEGSGKLEERSGLPWRHYEGSKNAENLCG